MNYREFTEAEYYSIENDRTFDGRQYVTKNYAYKKRAQSVFPHNKQEWLDLCSFFNFRCCKCECEVIGGVPTKDHIIPITLGGTDCIKNMQPLCRQCNTAKGQQVVDYKKEYCLRHNISLPEKWQYNG